MSTRVQDSPSVAGSHPVVSTRYDARLVDWAIQRLGISKAELVKRALDDFMARLVKEAA
jgi:hypothetical protein